LFISYLKVLSSHSEKKITMPEQGDDFFEDQEEKEGGN